MDSVEKRNNVLFRRGIMKFKSETLSDEFKFEKCPHCGSDMNDPVFGNESYLGCDAWACCNCGHQIPDGISWRLNGTPNKKCQCFNCNKLRKTKKEKKIPLRKKFKLIDHSNEI